MGCGYSWERGHAGFNYPTEYKVGDRVALNVERRKPSERFPGTFCTKAEVDVGTVASATPKMVVRHHGAAEGGAGAKGAPMFYHVEYHIKFAHGGARKDYYYCIFIIFMYFSNGFSLFFLF